MNFDSDGIYDEIVLRKSNQVIPLVRFSRSSSGVDADLERLYDVLEQVQGVVDEFCNEGRVTSTKRLSRSEYAKLSRQRAVPGGAAGMNVTRTPNIPTMQMPTAMPPPPPPPPPAFNPLPPTMNFAVQPPRPTGMPANFWIAGGTAKSASRVRVKKRKTSHSSSRAALPGARIVTAVARIDTKVEYKAPSSLKMESLSNLKNVPPEEVQKLERDKVD